MVLALDEKQSSSFKQRFCGLADDPLDLGCSPDGTMVAVAMSGGVDSSLVVALLKEAGYKVIGLTMLLYDATSVSSKGKTCCAGVDIQDARRVADKLDVPHYVLDYQSLFKSRVIDKFADNYFNGITPVPCIACNKYMKFSALLEMSLDLGARALVTGHYATIRRCGARCNLYQGVDSRRDQSYFLFDTTKEQLLNIRFPLGETDKTTTRKLASDMGLSVADKPDSQDICFVPDGRYGDLLKKLRPDSDKPGEIVDVSGKVLGHHKGIIHYTPGQRRGLGISGGKPLYVVKIDSHRSRVIVSEQREFSVKRLALNNFNWLGDELLEEGCKYSVYVKLRSTQVPSAGCFYLDSGRYYIDIKDLSLCPAAGQACVLYEDCSSGSRVLGGGYIDSFLE